MNDERHGDALHDVHQLMTGIADRSDIVCPSCRCGTLSLESGRCSCAECGLSIDDVAFVLLHQDSSPAARRRRMWTVLAVVKLAIACGVLFMIAVAFDIEFLVAFSALVGSFAVFGLASLFLRSVEQRGAADIVTEEGVVPVRYGKPIAVIPWSALGQWRLTRGLGGRRRFVFAGHERPVFDFPPVPPSLVEPLEAFVRGRAPQAVDRSPADGRRAADDRTGETR